MSDTDTHDLPLECPFDGCDWDSGFLATGARRSLEEDYRVHERRATEHYEDEHAGRVRIKATLETEQLHGDRDPAEIADRYHDKFAEADDLLGFDLAYVGVEVVEAADDHTEADP